MNAMLSLKRATSGEKSYAERYNGRNAPLHTLDSTANTALRRFDSLDLHYANHARPPLARRNSAPAILGDGGPFVAPTRASQSAPTKDPFRIDMPPVSVPESTESWRQRISRYAPVPDFTAAVLALAGSWLPSRAATGAGAASGALWTGSAGMAELGNTRPHSWQASGTNALNLGAGLLSTAAPLTSGTAQAGLDYTASAAWGLSGLTMIGRAAADRSNNRLSRTLAATSGATNVAAAGLAAAATRASENNDSVSASWYGTASSALWIAGSTLSLAADRAASSTAPAEPSATVTDRPAASSLKPPRPSAFSQPEA